MKYYLPGYTIAQMGKLAASDQTHQSVIELAGLGISRQPKWFAAAREWDSFVKFRMKSNLECATGTNYPNVATESQNTTLLLVNVIYKKCFVVPSTLIVAHSRQL